MNKMTLLVMAVLFSGLAFGATFIGSAQCDTALCKSGNIHTAVTNWVSDWVNAQCAIGTCPAQQTVELNVNVRQSMCLERKYGVKSAFVYPTGWLRGDKVSAGTAVQKRTGTFLCSDDRD